MYSKEEARFLHHGFWESFHNYTAFYSRKVGGPIHWMLYKTGIKGLELKFNVDTKQVSVILEVNPRNEEKRFDYFVELDKYRNIINQGFGQSLVWEEQVKLADGKTVTRIYKSLQGCNYHNQDHWNMIFHFMATNMYQLQNNLSDILPVLKENLK
ncbi:MAG: DUF4268 domain-containing protein [Salinivirgaceae bacterium]|nr:DUF4268 domain-containing protein [Salinivirgaceae bacterium]